ncbi:tetratricopeptide (TPR) repeat protein [Saccharothrix tamanrassetensis]|uniref:Tetratricopeptide (TPR) repeat protein n=1 Tax=Saccharothrix tamanrassetensis TaxID=1051531 RepID=A0A841CM66_9PSEU|nr:tetratricopeptide repeat protein [Saccharothrix tamanrassetensis]MBB5959562.1 tetratricopeptide (TPR) repeat protein [Saccharothrix tamanrassetensis]
MEDDGVDVFNEFSGDVAGSVVQAGTIQQVVLSSRPLPVPRQLPPAVHDFAGRDGHLGKLDVLLPAERDVPAGVTIAVVDGTAGVGKTALVVRWAHRVQDRFPDGTLFADLRGHGPSRPVDPALVLAAFLHALGVADRGMPADLDGQASLYRSLLSGRRVLVVLDNAAASSQVRPLLPAAPGCFTVVTSRTALTGLVVAQAAHRITLDLFSSDEAETLVRRVIGDRRADAEPDAVAALVEGCARLPLALRIATTRIAARPHVRVADVVADITEEQDRLDALSDTGDDHSAVRTVFDWSYMRLPDELARTFRRLGLHPGAEPDVHATAALTGHTPRTARRHLEALADLNLVEPLARGRYRLHDLLRAYAAHRAASDETAEERRRCTAALITWYAQAATVADRLVFAGTAVLELDLGPPVLPVPLKDRARASEWLADEHATLLAAQRQAAELEMHRHVIALAGAARFLMLRQRVLWTARLAAETLGLAAAVASADRASEAFLLMRRGDSYQQLGRWQDSDADLRRELAVAREIGDPVRHREALTGLGRNRKLQHRYAEAWDCYQQALAPAREAGVFAEAIVQCNLSQISVGLGKFGQALRHAERELELRRLVGSAHGEAYALHDVAVAWQGLRDHGRAVEFCREAVARYRELPATERDLAVVLTTLAKSLEQQGDPVGAGGSLSEAVAIFTALGDPQAEVVRRRLGDLRSRRPP